MPRHGERFLAFLSIYGAWDGLRGGWDISSWLYIVQKYLFFMGYKVAQDPLYFLIQSMSLADN